MGSKYIDLCLAVFLGYFAFTRFESGQIVLMIVFAVLAVLNLFTAYVKHRGANDDLMNKEK